MDVTIIGTGKMARAISTRLLEGGHHITLQGHTPEKAEELAKELKNTVKGGRNVSPVKVGTIPGEITFLAIPFSAAAEVAEQYKDQLSEKIVVDITNPINYQTMQPIFEGSSGAEEISGYVPVSTRVLKAFNTTFATPLEKGEAGGLPLDIFIAGDDSQAKAILAELVESSGMRVIDTGSLARARQLEAMGLLNTAMQSQRNTNFLSVFKVID